MIKTFIHHNDRNIAVNLLDLSPTEIKVQHALGTASWYIYYVHRKLGGYGVTSVQHASSDPLTIIKAIESRPKFADYFIYQIIERLDH